jgi:dienelactone hydrolase
MQGLRASIVALVVSWNTIIPASAAETVQFAGARFHSGLTPSEALANGIPMFPPAPALVRGYVLKPAGDGPFPAVVALHGCAGMGTLFDPRLDRNFWPDLLISWGYAVLLVDSFSLRGVDNTCDRDASYLRVQDTYCALLFFSKQPYVDKTRIALLGFSAGGIATIVALRESVTRMFDLPDAPEYKAGIAFYPCFGASLETAKPLLILNGEADDWSRDAVCRGMMNLRPATVTSVKLITFPGAFHDFDRPPMYPGRMAFGHWLEYDAGAAQHAADEVRNFLTQNLDNEH